MIVKERNLDLFDSIGLTYVHNPFAPRKQSKFKSRDENLKQQAKRRQTLSMKVQSVEYQNVFPEEYLNLETYDEDLKARFKYKTISLIDPSGEFLTNGIQFVKA